jgi:hypothetical protein
MNMKHLVKRHRAQCMLYAFAMAMDFQNDSDVQCLIANIGHDGTEILWPELPEPNCYRGFHPCEIYFAAIKLDYAIYEFPRKVLIGHSDSTIKEPKLYFSIDTVILGSNRGVFITNNHAYAYDGFNLFDPDRLPNKCGDYRSHSDIDWHTFYKVTKIVWRGFSK